MIDWVLTVLLLVAWNGYLIYQMRKNDKVNR